jgi:protein AroM
VAARIGAVRIGAVTIGQSPRTDVVGDFLGAVGAPVELLQRGALDGLSREEIAALAPAEGDYVLVTRLRDGTEVKVAESRIRERMAEAVRFLENEGVSLVVLFCTGEFPGLVSRGILLRPDALLNRVVGALIGNGRLGVCVPAAEQIPAMTGKWKGVGRDCVCVPVSPYTAPLSDFKVAAAELAARGADLVVMDCIGYSREMKEAVGAVIGVPVVLPRTFLGRIAGELLGGRQ